MAKVKFGDWFKAGAIMGGLLSVLLPLLIAIPTIGITFSIYNIRENLAAYVGQGSIFGQYLLAFVGEFSVPGILIAAVGMGVLVFLARHIVGMLKFIPVKHKFPAVFVVAALLQGIIMTMQLPAFELMPILFLGLTALILSYLLKTVYKQLKMPLPA